MASFPSGRYDHPLIIELGGKNVQYSFDGKVFVSYEGPFLVDRSTSLFIKTNEGIERFDYIIEDEIPDKEGAIFIIGGADKSKSIHEALVKEAGGQEKTRIAFIPAGSANPYAAGMDRWVRFERYCNLTVNYDNIPTLHGKYNFSDLSNDECFWIVPVALLDDPNTNSRPTNDPDHVINDESTYPDINEASWKDGAEDVRIAQKLLKGNYTLIFFTGGNQTRYISTFFYEDGREKLLFQVIKYLHRKGAVIAGTSAGAASLSQWMILSGGSAFAWTNEVFVEALRDEANDPEHESVGTEGLVVGKGLGFLPSNVITDTHFSERGRQGRLFKAIDYLSTLETEAWGIGVDEDTAAVIHKGELRVVGSGGVFLAAKKDDRQYLIHYLVENDRVQLGKKEKFSVEDIIFTGKPFEESSLPFSVIEPDIFGRHKFNRLVQQQLNTSNTLMVFGLPLNDKDEESVDYYPSYGEKTQLPLFVISRQKETIWAKKEILLENFGKKDKDFPKIIRNREERISYKNIQITVANVEVPFLPDFYNDAPSLDGRDFADVRETRIGLLFLPSSQKILLQVSFYDYAYDEDNKFLLLRTEPCEKATVKNGEITYGCDENGFCSIPGNVFKKLKVITYSGIEAEFEIDRSDQAMLMFSKVIA